MGEHLLNFWRWLLNTVQQAAIAEAPAVMTAAGHKINRTTKKVEYNHLNDKGVKLLRSNLAQIGEAAATAPGAAEALELGYNVVRHPKQTYKATKHAVSYLRKNLRPIKPAYKITAENAASITPEQWTAAQDAAIARGDMAKAQRLRDLHFKVSAPETKQRTPMFNASGESTFNEFNGGETGLNWFSESEKYASNHGVPRAFYINEPDIYLGNVPTWINGTPANKRYIESLKKLGYSEDKIAQKVQEINEAANSTAPAAKSVGMGSNNELVTRNNNTIKLADAVTYDNNGVRIPLGKRDNFNINDIRYALFPFVGGGVGYGLYNTYDR